MESYPSLTRYKLRKIGFNMFICPLYHHDEEGISNLLIVTDKIYLVGHSCPNPNNSNLLLLIG